jgi:hypothetical protein
MEDHMSTTLTVHDASTVDREGYAFLLDLDSETISVQELIRSRVFQEVQEFNAKQSLHFRGLIQPTGAEATLNGFKLHMPRHLDWEQQFEVALQSFHDYGFLILVDDQQVTDLDQMIEVKPDTRVSFLKLVPLVGG